MEKMYLILGAVSLAAMSAATAQAGVRFSNGYAPAPVYVGLRPWVRFGWGYRPYYRRW